MVARYPVEVAMTENPNYIGDGVYVYLMDAGLSYGSNATTPRASSAVIAPSLQQAFLQHDAYAIVTTFSAALGGKYHVIRKSM